VCGRVVVWTEASLEGALPQRRLMTDALMTTVLSLKHQPRLVTGSICRCSGDALAAVVPGAVYAASHQGLLSLALYTGGLLIFASIVLDRL
jgi:hypothetical protein